MGNFLHCSEHLSVQSLGRKQAAVLSVTVIGPTGAQPSVQLSAWGCKPGLCVLNIHSILSYTQPPGFLLYLAPYQTQHVPALGCLHEGCLLEILLPLHPLP